MKRPPIKRPKLTMPRRPKVYPPPAAPADNPPPKPATPVPTGWMTTGFDDGTAAAHQEAQRRAALIAATSGGASAPFSPPGLPPQQRTSESPGPSREQPFHPGAFAHVGIPDGGLGHTIEPSSSKTKRSAAANAEIKIKNRKDALLYSRLLIAAFDEVLDYDPLRQHNQTPPDLYIDDPTYVQEIRSLVAELRTLNTLLENPRTKPKATAVAVIQWSKHANTFLDLYVKSLARPTAWLTIAAIAQLLSNLGVGQEMITLVLGHIKFPR